ncbi:MAG: aminopeptidase P family protein [candidate division NC10 bacterium]|nr:aminopeptidase P family protein [candidate division NC10 bacterium]
MPAAEIARRIALLQQRLQALDLNAALILQNADLYYFTGTIQDGVLLVPAEAPPLFFVRRSVSRAREEGRVAEIVPYRAYSEIPRLAEERGWRRLGRLGLELDVLPVSLFQRLQKAFPTAEMVDLSMEIRILRTRKSPWEVEAIRAAAVISERMVARLTAVAREGMTEVELAAEVEAEARRAGHQGQVRFRRFNQESFYGHLLAGPHGAVPAFLDSPTGGRGPYPAVGHGASFRPIRRGEPILFDLVGACHGYYADMTRTFVLGEPGPEVARAFTAVRTIWEAAGEALRSGLPAGGVFAAAVAAADETGYGEAFMRSGEGGRLGYVGHGVGLEIDELPFLARGFEMPLEEGMVVAVEPKLVLPEIGVIGLEDTFLIRPNGAEALTTVPRDLTVLTP